MISNHNKVVVFDLDDTLFKEIDFLKSAFDEIAAHIALSSGQPKSSAYKELLRLYREKRNVFSEIIALYGLKEDIPFFLNMYRNHIPAIELPKKTAGMLGYLRSKNYALGIVTDGRSIQQRNKITCLGLTDYFEEILISEEFGSEKPALANFEYFEKCYGKGSYYYIGDNTDKDFIAPNKLGWTTIGLLDNGQNIHPQNLQNPTDYLPSIWIADIVEVGRLIS